MSCWSYMSDVVRPCCWFCIQKCSPPSRTKILSRFLPAMLSPFGGRLHLGSSAAILWPRWCHLAADFGDFGVCVEGYMGSFWTMLLRHNQKQPKDTPPKRPPLALKARQNQIKNCPKTQKLRQNANLHGSKGKTKPKIHPISTFKTHPQWPCSLNLLPGRQHKGGPPESDQLEGNSATSTPCADRAVWADLNLFEEIYNKSFVHSFGSISLQHFQKADVKAFHEEAQAWNLVCRPTCWDGSSFWTLWT